MGGEELQVEQIRSLSKLPSRDVLYGQLVGIVASPVGGLVRSLNALLSGVAIALGQVQQKKESGEIPAGEAPVADAAEEAPQAEAAEDAPQAEAEAEAAPEGEKEEEKKAEPESEAAKEEPEASEGEKEEEKKAEPESDEPAKDENQADVSAEAEGDDAETKPTKED